MSNHTAHDSDTTEIWFDSDGTRLFAVDSGRGIPIILLHGGLASHLACRLFAAPLSPQFRVVTPDLRGSGRSHFRSPLGWDQLADDVAALVRHLGVDRAVIGGVSFGSGCAVRVALRHPALVAGLIVLTPVYAGADVGLHAAPQAAMQAMDAAGRRAIAEGVQVLYPLFDALPAPLQARARAMVDAFDAGSVATSTRFLASGAQPFTTAAELASITAPTLLVPGTDPYHPAEVAALYQRHLRRCTVRDVEATGYAAAIADFVDSQVG
jgi:pimeloyl-ACP methyl ester carboxylesterase